MGWVITLASSRCKSQQPTKARQHPISIQTKNKTLSFFLTFRRQWFGLSFPFLLLLSFFLSFHLVSLTPSNGVHIPRGVCPAASSLHNLLGALRGLHPALYLEAKQGASEVKRVGAVGDADDTGTPQYHYMHSGAATNPVLGRGCQVSPPGSSLARALPYESQFPLVSHTPSPPAINFFPFLRLFP